jgi:nucleotide-binding universal stress UspA family protein
MEINTLISNTIFCLKEGFKIENDKKSTIADKIFISGYIDFIKNMILPQSDRCFTILDDFKYNTNNLKAEGKFELLLEEGIEINADKKLELFEKNNQLQEYFIQRKDAIENLYEQTEVKPEIVKEILIEEKEDEEILINAYREKEDGMILVPWDFSEKSEQAFRHAINYSRILGGEINLVHIVKSPIEAKTAIEKLNSKIEELKNKFQVKPNYIIKEGSIFTTISEVATQSKAKLVIMGTHGMKGMQKLTGSWAMKVIIDSRAPFIVVQDAPTNDKVEKIIFPVDKSKETRQKIKIAEWISEKNPDALFQICRLGKTPNDYLERMISTNTNYVRSYFRQLNIKHEVLMLEGNNLAESVLAYSNNTKVDLIMILTTQNINITNYMIGLDEQKIIFNKQKVPVMCINPMKVKYVSVNGFGQSQ